MLDNPASLLALMSARKFMDNHLGSLYDDLDSRVDLNNDLQDNCEGNRKKSPASHLIP